MKRQARLTLVGGILFLIATLLAPAREAKQGDKDAKPNYYPLEAGNTWHYRVTIKGKDTTLAMSVVKHEKINGETAARLESPNVDASQHMTQTDKGVFRIRTNNNDVSPPFKLLAYPISVGAKWNGTFTEGKDDVKHAYEVEIAKQELVEVPAGKFKAVVVKVRLDTGGQTINSTYWFVQDVGFVKHTYTIGDLPVTLELERFERKK